MKFLYVLCLVEYKHQSIHGWLISFRMDTESIFVVEGSIKEIVNISDFSIIIKCTLFD